jgi:hypothetical protein
MDVASPNNIPTDRNCRNRPEGYCAETFGEGEVCLDGTCRLGPKVLVILDVSTGASCELPGGVDNAAGVDLIGVENGSNDPGWAVVEDVVLGTNGFKSTRSLSLANSRACAEPSLSTGCGGWVTLSSEDPFTNGERITVYENGDTCNAAEVERYRLSLCTDEREVTLARDLTSCTFILGEGTGQRTFTVSF